MLVGPFTYRHIKKEVCPLSHLVDGHLSQQLWKMNLHSFQNLTRVTHTFCKGRKKKKEQSVFGVPDNGVQVEDASSESDSSVSDGKQDSPLWP